MRNVEFIEKSSIFHSYKKILYFRDFDLKSDVKIFFHIHFCRARRALSNHIKYFKKKKFYSTFELRAPYIIKYFSTAQ